LFFLFISSNFFFIFIIILGRRTGPPYAPRR